MSSLDDLESPWGQLLRIDHGGDDSESDVVPIVGNNFTIGRGKGESRRKLEHRLRLIKRMRQN